MTLSLLPWPLLLEAYHRQTVKNVRVVLQSLLFRGKNPFSNERTNPRPSLFVWLQPHNLVWSNREFRMLSVRRSTDVKRTANKHQKAGTTPDRGKDLQASTQGSITARAHQHKNAQFLHLLMRLISGARGSLPRRLMCTGAD